MFVEKYLILIRTTIPVCLVYAVLFGLNNWLDFTITALVSIILGTLIGTTLHITCLLRKFCGSYLTEVRKRPIKPLIIFDRENEPCCIPVRECLSAMDTTILVYPLPLVSQSKSLVNNLPLSSRFLHEYRIRSGSEDIILPFMEDPNTGVVIQGSTEEIITYMYLTYCKKGALLDMMSPLVAKNGKYSGTSLVKKLRSTQPYGMYVQPSLYNCRPLKLYAHESHADSKAVREVLSSYQLHYEYITCAAGSAGRTQLILQTSQYLIPVIYDPATGIASQGKESCLKYLHDVYGIQMSSLGSVIQGIFSQDVDKVNLFHRQTGLYEEHDKGSLYEEEDEDEEDRG